MHEEHNKADALVWQSLNHTFCSFKSKVQKQNFCRHEMNVTGLCNKSACPLSNHRYATIREEEGWCYLYERVPKMSRYPTKMWKKTKLPKNYTKALEIVTRELEYYPKFLQHRSKQRLTRIHQYLIRMRKLALQTQKRPKIVPIPNQKNEIRENRKEKKALAAARLNESIQQELLQRLKQGTYGDIYNFPATEYNDALDEAQTVEPSKLMDQEDHDDDVVKFVEAELDDDDDDDLEDQQQLLLSPPENKKRKASFPPPKREKSPRRRVEIQYDDDDDDDEVELPLRAVALA